MYFRFLPDHQGAVSYLLGDLEAAEAVLIDPRADDVPLIQAMLDEHRLQLARVLYTHRHDPSVSPLAEAEQFGLAAQARRNPEDGETVAFGHEVLRVFATPGHTLDSRCFRWRDRLFCGDLLSIEGCPDQAVPASPEALWDSVTRRVFTLPAETLLFTAHAVEGRAVTTVLEQRLGHPWFAGLGRDDSLARMQQPTSRDSSPLQVRPAGGRPVALV